MGNPATSKAERSETAMTPGTLKFSVDRHTYLGADGQPRGALPDFARDPRALLPLYEAMVLTRVFDQKAIALQRTGRIGT